jgi:1-deoxy-D-xylulose-5-phosphate synthase
VTFAVDRAGFVGADGATHHGAYDLSFTRCIPNIVIMTPSTLKESWQMLDLSYKLENPSIVRYPRGTGEFDGYSKEKFKYPQIELGKSFVLRDIKSKITILFFGPFKSIAMKLGELFDARVVNMRFVKPIDMDEISFSCQNSKLIVTIEENAKFGGAGSSIAEVITETKKPVPVLKFGIPDFFLDHGTQSELLDEAGLTYDKIVLEINNFLK